MIYALSPGLEVIFTFIIIGIFITLLFFLIKGVLRGFKDVNLEKYLLFDGLISFSSFNKALKKVIKESKDNKSFSLVFLQIDNFSNLETNLNQQLLREVLEEFVKRVLNNLPYGIVISAFKKGGFYIYFDENSSFDEVMRYNYDLKNALKEEYQVSKKSTIKVPASIATSFYPFHGDNVSKLYRSLDLLMKSIVYDGGDAVRSNALDEKMSQGEYLDYFQQIKAGIKNKEFEFYYQPAINILNNSIYSLRAYIRWNHPELGVLPAHKFIKVLDESGDIYQIAIHGLEMIYKDINYLKKTLNNKDLIVLNFLGDKELSNPNILKDFTSITRRSGISPENIVFEIDEANLLKDKEDNISKNIISLKRLGFKFAVDTFGLTPFDLERIGPSKIDILKLNRLFLEETDEEARNVYIKMLVDFAKKNNLNILAEQIETEVEQTLFKNLKITNQQGYLYSKALALNEVELWYQTFKTKANQKN